MFTLQNPSSNNNKIIINCPNCHQIPFVFFNKTKPDHIQIKCNCLFNQSYPLHNYINQFKSVNFKNIHKNINNCICPNHPDSSFICFCETCKSHLCFQCLPKHNQHKIIQLNVFLNEEKLKTIEDNIKQAHSYLEEHNLKLKHDIIEALKNQIHQIEDAYTENSTINKDILYFIKILLANYSLSPMNYYSISNLINNTQFNFKIIEKSSNEVSLSNIKKLISFYKQNYIIKTNYIDINQFYINKTINEHNSTVYTLILLSDGRLASCSWDFKIKIYNAITYECEITIEKAHQDYVNSITELSDGKLVSCSSDTTIKIWTIGVKDYNLITSFKSHSGVVFKVITLTNNRFASCSYDNLIKIYRADSPYKNIATLTGHTGSVRSILQIHDTDLLVSGSDDDNLLFWNLVN